jgi:hypothetical protein
LYLVLPKTIEVEPEAHSDHVELPKVIVSDRSELPSEFWSLNTIWFFFPTPKNISSSYLGVTKTKHKQRYCLILKQVLRYLVSMFAVRYHIY